MFSNPTPSPKRAPKGPKDRPKGQKSASSEGSKKYQKGPNCGRNKNKYWALLSHYTSLGCFLGFVDDPVMYIPVYYRLGTWLLAIA